LRFRQILLNLLSNAAKFSERGDIVVRARVVNSSGPEGPRYPPPKPGRYVEISVSDPGQGIAPQDLNKLFEAFSQVDASPTRKTGGTGLGLSICRQLVDLHGGRIWVESVVGQGSTFFFTVPTFDQPLSDAPSAPPAPPATGAPVVLAADDDARVVNLYRRYLEPHGYAVVGVNHSDAIVARAAELQPAVILLDVLMPNKDGWQVLAELRQSEATRALPIIICTLVADPARGLSLGADDYLMKPILEGDLLRAFAKLKLTAKPQSQ
jgi:CheY-like chemotaxis protein